MTQELPSQAKMVVNDYPNMWQAFTELGKACAESGPLEKKSRRLVKLALAIGGAREGAVHSHVRQGIDEGLTADEIRHVALLAAPTLGFPTTVAALTWVNDVIGGE